MCGTNDRAPAMDNECEAVSEYCNARSKIWIQYGYLPCEAVALESVVCYLRGTKYPKEGLTDMVGNRLWSVCIWQAPANSHGLERRRILEALSANQKPATRTNTMPISIIHLHISSWHTQTTVCSPKTGVRGGFGTVCVFYSTIHLTALSEWRMPRGRGDGKK